jgi:urease accessory protein
VPVTFVLVMAVGGALGVAGIGVPFVEVGIALSVIVLGAIV